MSGSEKDDPPTISTVPEGGDGFEVLDDQFPFVHLSSEAHAFQPPRIQCDKHGEQYPFKLSLQGQGDLDFKVTVCTRCYAENIAAHSGYVEWN